MIQSPELKSLILQLYGALLDEKAAEVAQELFSTEEGFLSLGSGPNEWWQNAEIIRHGYRERVKAGGSEVRVLQMEAFHEGTVGWVVDRVVLKTPDGDEFPVRHTYIFHQQEEHWKIVHAHYSLEISNENF